MFVHFLDADNERMWTDDHDLPIPTTQWKPGQTIEYTRTMFVPIYPYQGATTVLMGLYSLASDSRLPLAGTNHGQRSYVVGQLDLLPRTEGIFVMFKEGWHAAETPPDNAAVEWQWTRKEATLSVRNPKKDVMLYLHLDQPGLFPGAAAGHGHAWRPDDRLVRARAEERADSQADDYRRSARHGRCGGSEDFGR